MKALFNFLVLMVFLIGCFDKPTDRTDGPFLSSNSKQSSSETHPSSTVKSSEKNLIDVLKKDLSKDYKITASSSDLPSSSSTDALIIVGK